jgi:hypothetical protein
MTSKERKEYENFIYDQMNTLEPSEENTMRYRQMFSKMDDKEFEKWLKNFFNNKDANFTIETIPYKRELELKNIVKTAKKMGVPLLEKVALPFENPEGEVVWTATEVPVMYINIKRVQQMIAKKNAMSTSIEMRDSKSGQVTGGDKNARSSDVENIALIAINADETLKEMIGPRSDNLVAKAEMLKKIAKDGYVSNKDYKINKFDKIAINTMDVYFLAAGIKTNLVTDGLILKRTLINQNKDKTSISRKYVK